MSLVAAHAAARSADLETAMEFPLVPPPRVLKDLARWSLAPVLVVAPDGSSYRGEAWTCDSRCPGLRVQVGGELKERHLGLIHAQTGMTVASRVLRWPPTSEGLDLALEASEQAKGLRPENAWLLEDPWRGDLASAQAAIRSLARKVGSPSIWYVGGSAPLKGWPEEVRRTAEETAKERRAPVEVLGYADGQDLREQIPMVTYRVDPR